ncbi:MAG: 16S rRNA (cytosine(967)-C(5))-methyltransferase RsmB [Candidatus Eisenbacteria sp.]|nr:16S rRNA (cytosine(967)-C(5))-methyltransferase RsmB [Candidatus Eisenbacteria bacterium]
MRDARTLALEILIRCEEDRIPADPVLGPRLAQSGLDERDRRLVTSLVRTTHRWRGRADRVLDGRLIRGVRSLDARTINILRLGFIQLFHLDQTPPHAAIHTSVQMARQLVGEGKGRLVNRILRDLVSRNPGAREWGSGSGADSLEGELSHPSWLIDRWLRRWGEDETRRICEWNNQAPDFHLRVRGGKDVCRQVRVHLEREGRAVRPGAVLKEAVRTNGTFPVHQHPLLNEGAITLQDESQMLVAHLWPNQQTGWILDLCASPGTKSSHLTELNPQAYVLAADLKIRRLRRIVQTKARLKLSRLFPLVADGTRPPFRAAFPRILLDAPCTALGVLRRRPDTRWLRCPGDIADACTTQRRLLEAAAGLVLPGGLLLYSVCTLEPEETDQQIEGFLERHPEFHLGSLPPLVPEVLHAGPGSVRILPGVLGMEGLYAALLQRTGESVPRHPLEGKA